jgi:hypothetical protein
MLDREPFFWRALAREDDFPPEARVRLSVGDDVVGVSGGEVGLAPATVWPTSKAGVVLGRILSEWANFVGSLPLERVKSLAILSTDSTGSDSVG